jgi:hypothetical protein
MQLIIIIVVTITTTFQNYLLLEWAYRFKVRKIRRLQHQRFNHCNVRVSNYRLTGYISYEIMVLNFNHCQLCC